MSLMRRRNMMNIQQNGDVVWLIKDGVVLNGSLEFRGYIRPQDSAKVSTSLLDGYIRFQFLDKISTISITGSYCLEQITEGFGKTLHVVGRANIDTQYAGANVYISEKCVTNINRETALGMWETLRFTQNDFVDLQYSINNVFPFYVSFCLDRWNKNAKDAYFDIKDVYIT